MYALRNLKLVSIISPNKEKFFKENDKNSTYLKILFSPIL